MENSKFENLNIKNKEKAEALIGRKIINIYYCKFTESNYLVFDDGKELPINGLNYIENI